MYHDMIVRFMRVRPNFNSVYSNNGDAAQFGDVDRIILDPHEHVLGDG